MEVPENNVVFEIQKNTSELCNNMEKNGNKTEKIRKINKIWKNKEKNQKMCWQIKGAWI